MSSATHKFDWVNEHSDCVKETIFLDMLDNGGMDQLVMESMKGLPDPHLNSEWCPGLGVSCKHGYMANVIGNSYHNAIRFHIVVGGKLIRKSSIVAFNFKQGTFSKMRGWIKKNLKDKAKARVKSLIREFGSY